MPIAEATRPSEWQGVVRAITLLRRVGRMSVHEVAYRSRELTTRWVERAVDGPAAGRTPGALRRALDRVLGGAPGHDAEIEAAIASDLFDGAPRRFFAGAAVEAAALDAVEAGETAAIIRAANAVCAGRFDLLGYTNLSFGDPIDWHFDPVSGRRAPSLHWTRIRPLDVEQVGDSKVIWELNRHQWLVRVAQAYHLTGRPAYARACARYLTAWLDANPPGVGVNWTSSLELAYRLIAWCWTLMLLRRCGGLGSALWARTADSIHEHASRIERHLSYYFAPNTHLTGEALGLFYAGVCFPEFGRAAGWRQRGATILVNEASRQIAADGVYFEHSAWYQRYTIEMYLHFLILAGLHGVAIPGAVGERLCRMLEFLLNVRWPDGSAPRFGDDDGGRVLPLGVRSPDDMRDLFSTAAVLFDRPDFAWAAGRVAPETLWLLGADASSRFSAVGRAEPAGPPSRLFPSGYAVMRSDWTSGGAQLVYDVGPIGQDLTGAHAHAGLLAIQCGAFGDRYIVDSGTGTYSDSTWRAFFRQTSAHSTITIDGKSQATTVAPFKWRERPASHLRRWHADDRLIIADAEHGAYGRSGERIIHRRRVVFVKSRYWLVVDDLLGHGEHRVESRFQCAGGKAEIERPWVRIVGDRGSALLLRPLTSPWLSVSVRSGVMSPLDGWHSPSYGQYHPAPVIVGSGLVRFPARIVTLLVPVPSAGDGPPVVGVRGGEGGASLEVAVSLDDRVDTLRVDEDVQLTGHTGDSSRNRAGGRSE
jgi:hypothetical protein